MVVETTYTAKAAMPIVTTPSAIEKSICGVLTTVNASKLCGRPESHTRIF